MTPREFQMLMDRFEAQDELLKQATHDVINRIDNVTRAQISHEVKDDKRFESIEAKFERANRQVGAIERRMAYIAGGCTVLFLLVKFIPSIVSLLKG